MFSDRISQPSAVPMRSMGRKSCRCIIVDLIKETSMQADKLANPTEKIY
jgi:hypothetical protein